MFLPATFSQYLSFIWRTQYIIYIPRVPDFCVLVSYIFVKWAGITDPMSGAKGGAIIGLLYGAGMNLFMYSSMEPNYGNMLTDIIINSVMGAIAGAAIAFIIGKMK
ncbi:MAG: hypothetical protein IPL08_08965 [Saprospiraceae bacterium]|nr:hypothetical protein [Saprospiraceae bacterium]